MSTTANQTYEPDRSLAGKIRRRWVRLYGRRPAHGRGPGRPRLSITFDDCPITSARAGAEIVEAHGGRATYYIASGLIGTQGPMGPYASWADVERLHGRGHEIGCHTFAHTDLGQADTATAERSVADNQSALAAHGLPGPVTFAYPYGDVAAESKAALASRFALLRALHHGLVERGADLNQAPSISLEGPHGEGDAVAWLRRAAQRKAWLILTAHDIQAEPSLWGCTPRTLNRLLDEARNLGFDIVTVAQGALQAA